MIDYEKIFAYSCRSGILADSFGANEDFRYAS